MKQPNRVQLLAVLALFSLTLALYWPVIRFPFIVVDDPEYVYDNFRVAGGLSMDGVKWAFSTAWAANWHPLTWISHMADSSLHGLFAGGHHLTNLVLHGLNAVLVVLLVQRLTRRFWVSVLVAALFAWHPLHVESVAWVAERKDVLSTFFFLLTLLAYIRYAQTDPRVLPLQVGDSTQQAGSPHRTQWYALSLALFVLALLSKPMVVTLPFVLLLLDCWPLGRLPGLCRLPETDAAPNYSKVLLEKIPFVALSLASCVVTVIAQSGGGAVKSLEEVPVLLRLVNAMAAYGGYVWKTLFPVDLCVFYPLPRELPWLKAAASLLGVAGAGWAALRLRSKQPWLAVGLCWFLGTLVPVIGLVQVGTQSAADRYMYIPSLGLFLAGVLALDHQLARIKRLSPMRIVLPVVALGACYGATLHQVAFWQDTVSLCTRALAVTRENAFAENNLGVGLSELGRSDEAMRHFREALRLKPHAANVHYNLAIELARTGKLEEAMLHFDEALKTNPRSEVLHNNIGTVLAQQGKLEAADQHFRAAIQLNPDYPKPYLNHAAVLEQTGEPALAMAAYRKALQLNPDWPQALDKLALFLINASEPSLRNPLAAIELGQRANQLTGQSSAHYLATLAKAHAAAGQHSNAVAVAEKALRQAKGEERVELARQLEEHLGARKAGS